MTKKTKTALRPAREPTWDHFVHGADIGVEGRGPTLASSFEQAALALTAVITNPALVEPSEQLEIACGAPDAELLLADWLNVLIYEMATRRRLFSPSWLLVSSIRPPAWYVSRLCRPSVIMMKPAEDWNRDDLSADLWD